MPRARVVDLRQHPHDVYAGRPAAGEPWRWGNPYGTAREGGTRALVIVKSKDEAVRRYAAWLRGEERVDGLEAPSRELIREELAGRTLGCFCAPKAPCHARVLAHVADGGEPLWPLPERPREDPLPDASAAALRVAADCDREVEAALLRGGRRLVSFDIETSVESGAPICITWCELVPDPEGWLVAGPFGVSASDPRARELFESWLADGDAVLLGQNVSSDLWILALAWGLLPEVVATYEAGRVRDTMIRQRIADIAWPARLTWSPEYGRLVPRKFAPHAGTGGEIRIDESGDEDGGGTFGAKGGLDALFARHLGGDLSAGKHGTDSPRLRFGEVAGLPFAGYPLAFRAYALGDPDATLQVYLAQRQAVLEKAAAPERERLPRLIDEGWADDDLLAPLVDECFQCAAALPFQAMSSRGMRSDRPLVQRQRAELAELARWAEELMVERGVARREPTYAPLPPGPRRRRKKGEPAPEREVLSWQVKVCDDVVRSRIERLLRARGQEPELTKSGKKIKADADTVFSAVDPGLDPEVEGDAPGAWSDAAEADDPQLSVPLPSRASAEALRDLGEVLGPRLLKVARRALAGSAAERESCPARAAELRAEAASWSLERLRRAIDSASDPGLAAMAVAKKAVKFDTSFLRGLDTDDDLRAWFRTMMDTGRTSMVGRVRQNMPKTGGIRECIIPRPGWHFVQADYSQIELLGLAAALDWCVGRESTLTRAIRDGVDCHLRLACHPALELGEDYDRAKAHRKACGEAIKAAGEDRARAEAARPELDWERFDRIEKGRQNAKAANFGFPGGMGARKFCATCKKQGILLTLEQAEVLREAWLGTWPEVRDYFAWASRLTAQGRSAAVRHFDGGHWRGGCAYTQLCNTLFQGLVARGAKLAAWALFCACYLDESSPLFGCRPVLFVHDEFVVEAPRDRSEAALPELIRLMVEAMLQVMPAQAVKAEGKVLPARWTK